MTIRNLNLNSKQEGIFDKYPSLLMELLKKDKNKVNPVVILRSKLDDLAKLLEVIEGNPIHYQDQRERYITLRQYIEMILKDWSFE